MESHCGNLIVVKMPAKSCPGIAKNASSIGCYPLLLCLAVGQLDCNTIDAITSASSKCLCIILNRRGAADTGHRIRAISGH